MPRQATGRVLEPRRGRRVIDARAWSCLERCRRKLRLDEIPLPVPVEQWIEGPLGLSFGFTDLSHLGENVLGAVHIEDREILIDPRVTGHEGRFRFTCAHELGHLILHQRVRTVFQENGILNLFRPSPDRYERQADRFAAAFLMPLPLMERELVRIIDQRGLKRGKAVVQLLEPTTESEWLWRRIILPEMTRRFGVSLAAAVHRFNDIQAKALPGTPLLPREFVPLLQRKSENAELRMIDVENGRPVRRTLFDSPSPTERAV